MTEEDARKILDYIIQPDDSLRDDGRYVSWDKGNSEVFLGAGFDADKLEAIAWWMRNK